MDFRVSENGRMRTIHDFDSCIESLSYLHKDQKGTIERLQKQVKDLKAEHYKDEKLAELQRQLDEMKEDCSRGFPISKNEEASIERWKDSHIRKKHWDTKKKSPKYAGAIGGRFTYQFIPTSIGIVGEVKCECGECFCFREL